MRFVKSVTDLVLDFVLNLFVLGIIWEIGGGIGLAGW